jgi:hypothetical protein
MARLVARSSIPRVVPPGGQAHCCGVVLSRRPRSCILSPIVHWGRFIKEASGCRVRSQASDVRHLSERSVRVRPTGRRQS